MQHEIKIESRYFEAVLSGNKTFEVRLDDRDYNVDDIVILHEFNGIEITGRAVMVKITYILDDEFCGIKENYVVFSFKRVGMLNKSEDIFKWLQGK